MKRLVLCLLMLSFLFCFFNATLLAQHKAEVLMVVAQHGFREEELFEPKKILESHGYQVEIASVKQGRATGMFGTEVKVAKALNQVDPKEYIAILIVGGVGAPKYLWGNKLLISLVKEFYQEKKVIGAICLSPVVLAQAGVLKGKEATCWPSPSAIEEMKKYGAIYVSRGVVVQGRIVTAKGPDYARDFGRKVLKILETQLKII